MKRALRMIGIVVGSLTVGSAWASSSRETPRNSAPARIDRINLEEARQQLTRLTNRDTAGPVTHAVTKHDDWALACEERQNERTCFASTFVEVGGQELKLKIGYAGPGGILRKGQQEQARQSPRPSLRAQAQAQAQARAAADSTRSLDRRLVLSIEGPATLDRNVGYLISSEHFAGAVRFDECVRECVAAISLVDPSKIIDGRGAIMHVVAAEGSRPLLWTVTTRGLQAAFKHLFEEMKLPEAPLVEPVRDPQALFERSSIPVPSPRAGGAVRIIDASAATARDSGSPTTSTASSAASAESGTAAAAPAAVVSPPRPVAHRQRPARPRPARTAEAASDTFVPQSR